MSLSLSLSLSLKIAHLHVTYRKIVIIFKSVELEHTPSSFPQPKIDQEVSVRSPKKKIEPLSILSDNSCFFTHNGITTQIQKQHWRGQESTSKTRLH